MSPSSMDIAMDMSIAIMSGMGLFFLLLPFLKECPVSPPPESERDILKDVKRGQRNIRKKTATVKGPTKQLFLGSTLHPFWKSSQKMDHLPPSQLLSYLKVLEHLIQTKFNQLFWGIRSVFSESVVATAHIFRSHTSEEPKYLTFCEARVPAQALPQAQRLPIFSQDQSLPRQIVTPNLVGVTQELENLPSSTTNQTSTCLQCRASEIACPTTERGTQTSLPTENQPWLHGLYWKDNIGYDIQKHQNTISKATGNLPRGTLHNKSIRTSSILPEHCQILQHHEDPENEDKATKVGEQGTHISFLPSRELMQLPEHPPENSDHSCRNSPQFSQPAQASILNYKCGKMVGSVPTGLPLKEALAKCETHNTVKKGLGVGAKKVPCTSSSICGKGLKPENTALRIDSLSNMNPAEHHSFLDSNNEMKVELNITELPVKRRRKPYLQVLEAKDLTPPGVPASNLPHVVYPSSPICDSKAEYYSKAAMILENLHHQDPGGTRLESISAARLESIEFIYSAAEVQKTQSVPPPAASHQTSKAHLDPLQRHMTVQQPAFYFQAKPQSSRTIIGTGRGIQQSNATLKMATHAPWRRLQEVVTGHPHCSVTVADLEEKVPPSPTKQSNALEVKGGPPCALKASLGSSEIQNCQATSINPRVFGSSEDKRSPVNLQTPATEQSQDSTLRTQLYSKIELSSKNQTQAWPVRHHPDGPSTVHPAKVSLPSQYSLPSFQNTCQNPKTSQGLGDVLMKRYERVETKEISVPKDKIEVMDLNGFHLHEERQSTLISTGVSQEDRLARVRPSIPSCTQLQDKAKTWIPEKGEATSISSWQNIPRKAFQYGNLSTQCKEQQDSLKNSSPLPATEHTQNVLTRKKLIYHMLGELTYLMNVLFHILENTEGDPSKVKGCKVEPPVCKLSASSHTSDTNHSRAASKMSCDHVSLEEHNHQFKYRGSEDKLQSGIDGQSVCEQHPKRVKEGTGFVLLPASKRNENPCRYRATGDKLKPGLAVQRARNPGKIRIKIGLGHCQHRRPEGHHHLFRYTQIGDKEQPGFAHETFAAHQRTNERMGCGCLISTKEKHPGSFKGNWNPVALRCSCSETL
ncbi:hypothetical protein APTSU1_001341000 [Apodemus speciosus]|uniref:SPATA31 domain-containing protein n=1 Tax=Apodemus speciosus TaxID=105296 RepID=A0ABQ0FFX2_APOSI